MFIIIDKKTKIITQTINENYGLQVSENESLQEITDSELIQKIATAYDYELVFDGETVTGMNVLKTFEEWKTEQAPLNELTPTTEEQQQADFEIRTINLLIEMGLL